MRLDLGIGGSICWRGSPRVYFEGPQIFSDIRGKQPKLTDTVVFKMVRPSRVTDRVDVDEIGQLSLVTLRVDE